MPWIGKSLCAPLHSTRLIDVFVAGMLVFIGIQVAANAAPVLKPHRLERSHLPQQTAPSGAEASAELAVHVAICDVCDHTLDHNFVHGILPVSPLVTDYRKAQIGLEDLRADLRGFRLAGTVSPRGPPKTST
ncbi:hypothetical protein [Agrobacterium sp. lyk4-40-TYG-31]|uniref:hypothetical protein n=1 Tax=Agrobacterium sp. lyk4-40-TYG-31 TaxID=3040276 RepID=UPI00254E66BD|nr:hypothetical protein [Agrobacterium sp. lyk4-40-TYG-31]